MMRSLTLLPLAAWLNVAFLHAQPVPAVEENIPFLVTFGGNSETSWGDDDFCQTFFFVVPKGTTVPVYLRVFDPECSGTLDEAKGDFNTVTNFSVYGGKGCISEADARNTDPTGKYRSGNLLASKDFGNDPNYDGQWYTFGPFDPNSGEDAAEYGGLVFKMVAQGKRGDDGNLYRFFMSSQANANVPIEGGNAFTFEYSFRLHDDPKEVSHIYPYVDDRVISVKQSNFDWDGDGIIRLVSVAKRGEAMALSGDDNWASSEHKIVKEELNTSLDIRFIKRPDGAVRNNNVVFFVRNQYGELLPFYTVPIGGIPQYRPTIAVTRTR
ncbi:MAG: hypothetical protein J5I62_10750 [Flavobacteriales bacterium]|nr:hypothetical protein [Flavobacteriales bacterium]MEB2340615.1 hypothetical protein [Flavobacteriia bacterium]